jgi:hypothetical protein
MRKIIAVAAVAAALGGCANWPRTSDPDVFLAAPAGSKVVRFEGTVPVPFNTAYRNILRAARGCWSRTAAIGIFARPIIATGDVDIERQEATIQSGVIGGEVFAVVKLNGRGKETEIRAAAADTKGGLPGSTEIPLLPKWAAGEPTPCGTMKVFM